MAIPESYVLVPKSLAEYLKKMRTAGIPQRVTFEFLKTLGLKSSNDRAIIGVLKSIGFLDASATPTDLYRSFRDQKRGPGVLAQAIRNAYSDVFLANEKAHQLPADELRDIFASKTTKGERVVSAMASTFTTLAKAADFSEKRGVEKNREDESTATDESPTRPERPTAVEDDHRTRGSRAAFHYNIQIHLPTTTDVTVYNAIFKSLRENLL